MEGRFETCPTLGWSVDRSIRGTATVGAPLGNCLEIAANVKIVARFFFCTLTLALSRTERELATARNDRALSLWEHAR
jgi:hypothetical protein